MARVDLTVMGGGIFGLSCAWEATRRGARVRLIDRYGIGAGSSGGVVGALAPHVPENWNAKKQFQLESLLMAGSWWSAVADAGGTDAGYLRSGRIQPVPDDRALANARARIAESKTLWQGQAEWSVVPSSGADWEPASPTGWLVHDTLSARISPRRAATALVAALKAGGAEILIGDAQPQGPTLWATGQDGLLDLSASFGKPVGQGVKGQALLLDHDARDLPQVFVDGLHIVPHADGTTAIGSTSENQWSDPSATDGQLDDLLARARAALPVLRGSKVIDRWAGVRPRARSRAPVLGRWPGRPDNYVANGGFKIGFGIAPKVAVAMADLILDGRDTIPDGFSVESNLS